MSEPITFTSETGRFALPLLFSGQAQKEFYVNEALTRIDTLMHPAIEGARTTPPVAPSDGEVWLVAPGGQGDWQGKDDHLATASGSGWHFTSPQTGMRAFDESGSTFLHYDGSWSQPAIVAHPTGGSTLDSEARAAIDAIISGLIDAGIFSQS